MTFYCRYHVLEPAEWRCTSCHIDFCPVCSPEPPEENGTVPPRKCPHCRTQLRPLSAAHTAPPFGQRLTDFLRYPFSPVALGVLLLAFVLPLLVPGGIALHVARLLFLVVICKYLWTAFEEVAEGRIEPMNHEPLLRDNWSLAMSLGVVLALLAAGVAYMDSVSGFWGSFFGVVISGLLPAFLVALGINRSLGSALSREGLFSAILGIGPVYAVVFLLPGLLLGGLRAFVSLFADILPTAVGQAMYLTAHTYFAIVVFVLAGYLLFQYQEALGFTPEAKRGRKTYKKGDPVQLQLEMFLKDGNYSKAVALLKADVERKMSTLSQHERYHRLIWAMNSENALREHGTPFLKQLVAAGRNQQAANVFRDYLQRFPDFRVSEADLRIDLAQAFEELGDYKLAVHMLNGMHTDNPHYGGLPDAYLLAARLLDEKLGMPKKAYALVQFLHGRFRNHRRFPDIQAALDDLARKLSAAPAG